MHYRIVMLPVSRQKARPLLAVTVDGRWHALDPTTGSLLWTMPPLDHQPLLKTDTITDDDRPVYLVEPVGDGALFAYIPGEAVHRLPLTVRLLVERSPGRLTDGTMHVGSVDTHYYEIDVEKGRVIGRYSSGTAAVDHHHQIYDTDGTLNTVLIGKVDYKLNVYSPTVFKKPTFSCSLSVFTTDNNEQITDTEYYSSNNGVLYLKRDGRVRWIHKFLQPVLYLFETVEYEGRLEAVSVTFGTRQNLDLINIDSANPKDDQMLYVLNGAQFPRYKPLNRRQVSQDELAIAKSDDHLRFEAEKCWPGSPLFPDCLIGQRSVQRAYHAPLLLEGRQYQQSTNRALQWTSIVTILVLAVSTLLLWTRRNKKQKVPNTYKITVHEDQVIGHGSQGTVVYSGLFEGRPVAVKRVLKEFFDIVDKEVSLLQHSDTHPNVIRYYCQDERGPFRYIALERCSASLTDIVERPLSQEMRPLLPLLPSKKTVCQQMALGLQHLHHLGIVHRDLKPGNILLSQPKTLAQLRVLISDFGLSRRLDPGQSHFEPTMMSGTIGWRAPEFIHKDYSLATGQITKKVDIFALGCLFYYVLSGGMHPFGASSSERELNICKHHIVSLQGCSDPEAVDLIERMLEMDPLKRPTCDQILAHPWFWSIDRKLAFLADVSDRLERAGDRRSPTHRHLESNRQLIIGSSWTLQVDQALSDDLGKYRKYFGNSVQDLLRAMRNKRHHFQELPEQVRRLVGETPESFYKYFEQRFPCLLITVFKVVEGSEEWRVENPFKDVYLF